MNLVEKRKTKMCLVCILILTVQCVHDSWLSACHRSQTHTIHRGTQAWARAHTHTPQLNRKKDVYSYIYFSIQPTCNTNVRGLRYIYIYIFLAWNLLQFVYILIYLNIHIYISYASGCFVACRFWFCNWNTHLHSFIHPCSQLNAFVTIWGSFFGSSSRDFVLSDYAAEFLFVFRYIFSIDRHSNCRREQTNIDALSDNSIPESIQIRAQTAEFAFNKKKKQKIDQFSTRKLWI